MPMPEDDRPAISVIMGVRCCGTDTSMLERAVRSILNQSFPDFEFLICADGSSREALTCLERLAVEDTRIHLVRGVREQTLSCKLNLCLRQARGDYIARMDDDDESYPERFAEQMRYLQQHPSSAFVGCNVALRKGGSPAGSWLFPQQPGIKDFYITQPFIHPTIVFRKEALERVGGYGEESRCLNCEDYDLFLRLYENGLRGDNLQKILFCYTLPETAKGKRTMSDRFRETQTRWVRFRSLGRLPGALPYVLKPIAAGLIPERILRQIKERKNYG